MRLSLNPGARALLRRLPRTNPYSIAELLLLAVLAVQSARLVWAMVTPLGPLGDWRLAEPGVAGSPVAILKGFDPFFRTSAGTAKTSVVTSLQLTLFGTTIGAGGGSAVIAGPDGVQQSVGVGEDIVPGARLKAVAFDHVTIDRGGATEELYIDQSGAVPAGVPSAAGLPPSSAPVGRPPTGPGIGVSAAEIKSDIAFIPRIDGGRISGLVVRPQGSGGAFRAVGLRDGDVVTAAGGRPIAAPADIDRIVAGLTPGANLSLTVERGADTLPIAVTIRGQ
ncbi:type II secretion system protein N [uncultured Sphingomonas sp.]|uniref:type II secretion system protein N n=1 Tax=uncultured Sphingomonas sp. TaxID=158754 RepID=UPI0035C98DD9